MIMFHAQWFLRCICILRDFVINPNKCSCRSQVHIIMLMTFVDTVKEHQFPLNVFYCIRPKGLVSIEQNWLKPLTPPSPAPTPRPHVATKYFYLPFQLSGHLTVIERRINVDATSWRCIDVDTTLFKRWEGSSSFAVFLVCRLLQLCRVVLGFWFPLEGCASELWPFQDNFIGKMHA